MEKNSTDVIIEDKVYKISTDQDASYVRELAEYINEKMELLHRQSAYSKQANAFRQIILLMNMADEAAGRGSNKKVRAAGSRILQYEARDGQYADDNSKLKKAAAGEAQDTGSMSISAVVSKRGRGKKYTDRADITREKTISAVWIIRKQCSGTQEKINYRKARAVCRGFVL